ncbi:HAD family hydrolase [Georgenia sp. Z1491]|uniref:HAD family hydrolase n=1 Tax=Georgenia sp. Z1491 TaxID=3416707 RepID=UPI003CF310A6
MTAFDPGAPDAVPVRGVVLDLDGTLVDTLADVTAALTGAFEEAGLPAVDPALAARGMGHGAYDLVLTAMQEVAPGRAADEAFVRDVHDRYRARYAAAPAALSTPYADAADVLPALRRAGIRVGICTNKSTALSTEVLRAVGLDEVVEVVLGRDSVQHPKPDPRHLLDVLDRLGLRPEETVYVGDNPVDVVVGAGAGVRYRHVAWGEPVDPDVVRIERFADLARDLDVPGLAVPELHDATPTTPAKEH